jgi:acyl-CoA hydrolase
MEARVVVAAENVLTGEVTSTNTAYIVYVALDDRGRPAAVPGLLLETEDERRFAAEGEERRAWRLERRRKEQR